MALRRRHVLEGLAAAGMLALALLIVAKLQTVQTIRFDGPFTVLDGDTLIDGGRRLRLHGIDAPELGQPCKRGELSYDCGTSSLIGLVRLLQTGAVVCSGLKGSIDRYGRQLVSCRQSHLDLGQELVAQGLAVAEGDYHLAEMEARRAGLGIWAGPFERPDDWRRRQRIDETQPRSWLSTILGRLLAGMIG